MTAFYTHGSGVRKGKPFSRCKQCWQHQRSHVAVGDDWIERVPMVDFRVIVLELHRRIGAQEAAKRMNVSADSISLYRMKQKESVRRMTYDAAVRVLHDARARGEDGYDGEVVRLANLRKNRELASRRGWHTRRFKADPLKYWQDELAAECERRRANTVTRPFGMGTMTIRSPIVFTPEEGRLWNQRGLGIPLDLWPNEWWDLVRERDCPEPLSAFPEKVAMYSEEWYVLQGRGDEF